MKLYISENHQNKYISDFLQNNGKVKVRGPSLFLDLRPPLLALCIYLAIND